MKNLKNGEFKVKFRGVRGSYPIAKKEYLEYGGNTPCIEVNVGGQLIILDAGTGLIEIGDDLMQEHIASGASMYDRNPINATLLLSHIHQDHIQGFTFFKPSHLASTTLNVFGTADYSENLADELASLLFTKSFPLDLGDVAANLNIYDIDPHECIVFDNREMCIKKIEQESDIKPKGDEVIVSCYKSYAHPREGVIVYKIAYKDKSLVYASDKESYVGGDKKMAMFSRDCDLLIHDAQYTTEDYLSTFAPKQGFGHSTFEMAIETKEQANAKKLAFFHFDPNYNDEKLNEIAVKFQKPEHGIFLAKEGMEVSLL